MNIIKSVFRVGVLFLFTSIVSDAQSLADSSRINVIKINPVSLAFGNISAFYERGISGRQSLMAGVNYMNMNVYKIPLTAYGLSLEYRYHFRKNEDHVPKGFYFSPFIRYQHFSFSEPIHIKNLTGGPLIDVSGGLSFSGSSIGMMIGDQHISKHGFSFDFFIGPYYAFASAGLSGSYGIINIPIAKVSGNFLWLRSGMALGYAF